MKYQPEVDGLRALAVVPVVLYHAGVAGFGGGFIGVDVFFVISGYLITGILIDDLNSGRFSLLHFYERRVRRIIPALMFVIAFTLVGGAILFLPYQLTELAWSAVNAITFTSNIWFWKDAGYFADAAALKPLIHTWSLAVEEQFYLFFPIGLYLLHRFRLMRAGIAAVLVSSLLLSIVLITRVPAATFYLLPTRAWELMLGALIALGAIPVLTSRGAREAIAAAGTVMILLPIYFYDAQTLFPGIAAIPPCLGAFLIILAGRSGGSLVTSLLSRRLPVAIGLISYSLYLWHWPLLVFNRQLAIGDPSPASIAACVAISFAIAWFSWRYVEMPFRDRSRFNRARVFSMASASAAVTAVAALLLSNGWPQRLSEPAQRYAAGHFDRPAAVDRCLSSDAGLRPCRLGVDGPSSFVVWGDSHAAALGEAVGLVAYDRGRAGELHAFNACTPGSHAASGFPRNRADRLRCAERNRLVEAEILADPLLETVIMVAYWQNHFRDEPGALMARLAATIERLQSAGKTVILLGDVPVPPFDIPYSMALADQFGRSVQRDYAAPPPDPNLAALAARTGARLISISNILCPDRRCRTLVDRRPLFFDGNHVTSSANRLLIAPALARAGLFD